MSLRDQILAAEDLRSEVIEVPEWDVTLTIKELTGTQRSELMGDVKIVNGEVADIDKSTQARMIAMCAYDADGSRVFTDDDVEALMGKAGSVLDRLSDVGLRVSGMDKKAADELGKD